MEFTTTWFTIDDYNSDLINVFNFVKELPSNICQIFDNNTTNFQNTFLENQTGITKVLFKAAFQEAKLELDLSLRQRRTDLKIDLLFSGNEGEQILKRIGFSNDSLKLKANILNKLWENIREHVASFPKGLVDFANNKLVKLFRKFLEYLNSILGSLVALIPGIEPMKEFKEIIESLLSLAEDE